MNDFDIIIIRWLHNISANSPILNSFMLFIIDNDFIKGGIVISPLWFFWFQREENIITRKKVISILFSCLFAIAVGRLLTNVFPFRMRPIFNPNLSFLFPSQQGFGLISESSMPSDHAVMFCALATGIILISKKIGLLTFLYVILFVLFPRIYLGYHYATDVLMGAAVGILITLIFLVKRISEPISTRVMAFSSKYPGIFYLLFFWLSFQIGTLFDSSRALWHYVITVIRPLV